MSRLTRAQKARLGVFALTGGLLILGTVVALVGLAALKDTTTYYIRLPGVGGLNHGAQVRYRGLRVGSVEDLRIADGDVETVRVAIAIERDTPIKVDTEAVLEMQGVTGLRYIELTGGTNDAAPLPPGGTIPAVGSLFELLGARATTIAANLDRITGRLAALADGVTGDRIDAALDTVDATIRSGRALVDRAADGLDLVIERAAALLDDLRGVASAGELTLTESTATVRRLRDWLDPAQLARLMNTIERAVRAADRRLSDDELGAVLAALAALANRSTDTVARADLTLIQVKDDLLRALDELVTGAEAFAEFASLLRDDPAALIRGRSEQPRELK